MESGESLLESGFSSGLSVIESGGALSDGFLVLSSSGLKSSEVSGFDFLDIILEGDSSGLNLRFISGFEFFGLSCEFLVCGLKMFSPFFSDGN